MSEKGTQISDNHICTICGKEVDKFAPKYSITLNHYDCEFPTGYKSAYESVLETEEKMNKALSTFGIKPKKLRVKRGTGSTTKKVLAIIEISGIEEYGDSFVVNDLWPTSPEWCKFTYDVMRCEGSFSIKGREYPFGSWCTLTELAKYKRVVFQQDGPHWEIYPEYETKRSRNKK